MDVGQVEDGDKRKKKTEKRFARAARAAAFALAAFTAVLFLAGTAAVFFLNTTTARDILLSRVNERIPGTLFMENHRLFPWMGELIAGGLTLKTPEGETVFTVGSVDARVSLSRLLEGVVFIERLQIKRPEGTLFFNEEGTSGLDRALFPPRAEEREETDGPRHAPAHVPLFLERLEISDGRLRVSAPGEFSADLRGIGVTGSADLVEKTGAAHLRMSDGTVSRGDFSLPVQASEIKGAYREGDVAGFLGAVRLGASSLSLSGRLGNVFGEVRPDLKISFSGVLEEIAPLAAGTGDLSGPLSLEATVAGSLNDPVASLRGNLGKGAFLGYPLDGAEMDLLFLDRVLSLERLDIAALGGTAAASGRMNFQKAFPRGIAAGGDLSAAEYEGTWKSEGIPLAALPPLAGRVSGLVGLDGSFRGRGTDPETMDLSFTAKGRGTSIASAAVPEPSDLQLDLSGSWKERVLSLNPLRIGDGTADIRVEGRFDPAGKAFVGKMTVAAEDLSRVPLVSEFVSLAGSARLEATGTGSLDKPFFTARFRAQGLRYGDTVIGDVDGDGSVAPSGEVNLSSLHVENGESRLEITGTAALFEKGFRNLTEAPRFQVRLRGDPVFLEDFRDTLGGKAFFEADLEGTLKNPRGRVRLQGRDLNLPDQELTALDAEILLEGGKIVLESLAVSPREGESVEAAGWFVPGGRYRGTVSSSGVSLESIGWIAKRVPLKGRAVFDFSGEGDVKNPGAEGTIAFEDVALYGRPLGNFSFHGAARDGAATLAGTGSFPLEGCYRWETGDFSADLSLAKKDLAPFFSLFGLARWGGEAEGTVRVAGNARRPEEIDGEIDLAALHVFYDGTRILSADEIRAEIRKGVLSLLPGRPVRLVEEGALTLAGRGALGGEVDFRIDGSVPLAAVGPFAGDLADLAGRVTGYAQVGGTFARPEIQGEILLENLGMTVLPLMERVRDVRGKIGFTTTAITVADVRGFLEEGPFSLDGTVALDHLKPDGTDLRLKGERLPFLVPNTLQVVMNADLALRGTPEAGRLEGTVTFVEGLYYRKTGLDLRSLLERRRSVSPSREPATLPYLKNLALDILFRQEKPFLVDNNVARLVVVQDLRAGGTWNDPLLFGRVTVQSGTVTYRDRTFTVDRGILDFTSPDRVDPRLDFQSRARVRDWVILLDVTGTLDSLKFILSSTPSEEDQDILALLLFGKTTRELAGGTGGGSASPEQMLAGLVASTLSGQVRELTGLDVFEIKAGAGENGEIGSNIQVTLGKKITRRFGVEYNVGSEDGEVVQEAVGEYKLLEGLLLRGFQNSRGAYGGEIQLRFEFR